MSIVGIPFLQASWIKRQEPCLSNNLCIQVNLHILKKPQRGEMSTQGGFKLNIVYALCLLYYIQFVSILFCIHYYSIYSRCQNKLYISFCENDRTTLRTHLYINHTIYITIYTLTSMDRPNNDMPSRWVAMLNIRFNYRARPTPY